MLSGTATVCNDWRVKIKETAKKQHNRKSHVQRHTYLSQTNTVPLNEKRLISFQAVEKNVILIDFVLTVVN